MKIFSLIVLLSCSSVLFAQNWKRVFVAPSVVSSGFFYSENEGCVGTGFYTIGGPAQIYYTTDGGTTWTRAALPNPQLTGQVTDIFFRDRFNGWATVKSEPESGWTGIYKTTDGGKIWTYVYQANYPTAIRETGRGVFVADRTIGILRSTNGGKTFTTVKAFSGALGLDFLDDNIGIHSGESSSNSPVMVTMDGGNTWQDVLTGREAWTPFADPNSRRMFYASERDNVWPPTESTVGMTTDNGATFSNPRYFSANGLTGGIAGSRKCRSAVYIQGQDTVPSFVRGLLRSTDNGNTWVDVGGPSNYNDTRFAVTGRGAVVYAFDKNGGVWKTTNGGDGLLTSSVRKAVLIQPPVTKISAKLCDSAIVRIPIRFTGCEQIRITNITFDEEFTLAKMPGVLAASAPKYDTIIVWYHPQQVGVATKQIRISFLQADMVAEDTVITINVEGTPIPDHPLITTLAGNRTLGYGAISICGGDSSDIITIANTGCAPMRVNSLTISNPAFSLLSAFKPFTLDPGTNRKFLIFFKPQFVTNYTGVVLVKTSFGADSIPISGTGIQGSRALRLSQPVMEATLCDTPEYTFILRNISCNELKIDSLVVESPFELLTNANGVLLGTDSTVSLKLRLVPTSVGTFVKIVNIYSTIKGERFDTTISILANVSAGAAILSLPTDVIDFGDVSTCSFGEASITFSNPGCDSLRGSISQSPASDFTLSGSTSFVLGKEGVGSFAFTFRPTQIGFQTSTFTITTNAGVRTVTLSGTGIDGSGTVQGIADAVGTILTCLDTTFNIQLINSACDTVYFDSLAISGAAAADYMISPPPNIDLAVRDTVSISGVFTPSVGGQRPATVIFYFHSKSGSVYQVPLLLDGSGIAVPRITLSMPGNAMLLEAGAQFSMPLELLGATALPVESLTFKTYTNTDLVELTRFELSPQYAPIATVEPLVINNDTVVITVQFNTPTIVQSGRLGDLHASIFLTDTLNTTVTLTDFSIGGNFPAPQCLLSSFDPSVISVALDPNCGDLVISKFLANPNNLVEIAAVRPNPSTGQIYLTLQVSSKYKGVCTIEIVDLHGKPVFQRTIENVSSAEIPISFQTAAGSYQLRVTSGGGVVSRLLQIVN